MLGLPRPKTRADCLQEARPCPWVGCRHHLLLEIATVKRDPTLVTNGWTTGERHQGGRRAGLSSSAAGVLVQMWIDDAVEMLSVMPYTCSLDMVDELGEYERRTATNVGWALGVTRQAVTQDEKRARMRATAEAARRKLEINSEGGKISGATHTKIRPSRRGG